MTVIYGYASKLTWNIQLSNHPKDWKLRGLSLRIKEEDLTNFKIGEDLYIFCNEGLLGKVIYLDGYDVRHDEHSDNFYRRLGLGINATIEEINNKYALIGNKNVDELPICKDTFDPLKQNQVRKEIADIYNRNIDEAYNTLKCENLRKQYDASLDVIKDNYKTIFAWFYYHYNLSGGCELERLNNIKEGDEIGITNKKCDFLFMGKSPKPVDMVLKEINL